MDRKVVALLQARTDSTRLPGKVLKPILGRPMVVHELIRVKRSRTINELILLTSEDSSDDELANIISRFGFTVFRGSKDNVLARFFKCTQELKLDDNDIIVRLTGDCPVHDATIIDELINAFLDSDFDYMTNCATPIYPDGFDVEVFTVKALNKAFYAAKKLSEKEHVTPYIRESGLFKTANLTKEPVYPEWRLTVDELDDLMVIEKIYDYFQTNDFSFNDIVSYLKSNPEIISGNAYIKRNEGYEKSIKNDSISNEKTLNKIFLKILSSNTLDDRYLSWMNDQEIVKYTEARWKNYQMIDLINYVRSIEESVSDFLYGIYLINSNKYIGNIKIGNINKHHEFADLGIILGDKEEWSKGYAEEAVRLAIDIAFKEHKLKKLLAGAYQNNIASIQVLKKAGFNQCGIYKNHCLFEGMRIDVIMFEIENK